MVTSTRQLYNSSRVEKEHEKELLSSPEPFVNSAVNSTGVEQCDRLDWIFSHYIKLLRVWSSILKIQQITQKVLQIYDKYR
jgi:hypothetical protein